MITLNPQSMVCTVDGTPVRLTRKLWMILMILRRAQGAVVPRIDMSLSLGAKEASRAPDTHIAEIRRLLGPRSVLTVYGFGWKAGPALLQCAISDSCQNRPEYEI